MAPLPGTEPGDDAQQRWDQTFHDAHPAEATPAERAAARRAIDDALVRRLLADVDEPKCYVPYCGDAAHMAFCVKDGLFIVAACDHHQERVTLLRRIRCPQCGAKGRPTDLLRWRPIFTTRSRA